MSSTGRSKLTRRLRIEPMKKPCALTPLEPGNGLRTGTFSTVKSAAPSISHRRTLAMCVTSRHGPTTRCCPPVAWSISVSQPTASLFMRFIPGLFHSSPPPPGITVPTIA
jgi:hypothetical protein